eukprot:Selendium_serpulae@DN3475_c0_g1_i1.p1
MGVRNAAGGVLPPWLNAGAPEVGRALRRAVARHGRANLWQLLRGAADSELPFGAAELNRRLGHVPTLVVGWSGDQIHELRAASALHGALDRSELFVATDVESYRRIPHTIADFLKRHNATERQTDHRAHSLTDRRQGGSRGPGE